jgi:hypothetical protein
MPTMLGSLRRLMLTPALAEVTFAKRGFPGAGAAAASQLEAIPKSVICGFEWGMDVADQDELESRLNLMEPELRGFGYEGATMAYTILDMMKGGRGHRTRDLLRGPGEPHVFLTYIGIGFAMSHLPRPLWRNVVPDLEGSPYHPTMAWLAVDGYGFDLAYFKTRRYVQRQQRPAPYPFLGAPEYFHRAVDQGIGRALWFIHAAQVAQVSAAVREFAPERHADLWSGVGLASTFAGGCSADDLVALRRDVAAESADFEAHLAQGAVFAAKARTYSGLVPPHSDAASVALTGMSAVAASDLADRAVGAEDSGGELRYEQWRRTIREEFAGSRAVAAS